MAQGEAISLLLRAYSLHQQLSFIQTVDKAIITFQYPIFKGGVCANFNDGSLSFEEFPANPPSHVLNGSLFAILGVFDYLHYSNNPAIHQIFQQAISGLKQNLFHYDTGYWTRYDLFPVQRLASRMYHKIHIQLLQVLSKLTGEAYFSQVATKWKRYLSQPTSNLRWGFHKITEKLATRF